MMQNWISISKASKEEHSLLFNLSAQNRTQTITTTNLASGNYTITLAYLYTKKGLLVEAMAVVCSYWLLASMREVQVQFLGPVVHTFFSPPSFPSCFPFFTPSPLLGRLGLLKKDNITITKKTMKLLVISWLYQPILRPILFWHKV